MANHLSQQDVEKVAGLARLDLTEGEKASTVSELESILTYIDRLSVVDTAHVEPYAAEPSSMQSVRKDVADPFANREALLQKNRFKDDLLVTKGVFSKGSDDES
jgi:aspartyl-tRNA(Asn)/glutamyl-tRNA(Gln) amidotransferase subunit C